MKIYEIMGCARSGHHTILNWIIVNHVGIQSEWKYKMTSFGNNGFHFLSEANHDIPLSYKFLDEKKNEISTILFGYEDTPADYTILNEDRVYRGPFALDYYSNYNVEHKGRIILMRNFYNNLSSRIKSNEGTIFTKWNSGNPHLFDVGEKFIYRWKSQARDCVNNKCSFLKFEDWINNKEIRDKFLYDTFGLKDLYGTKEIKGTVSSFGTIENVEKRSEQVEIPEETKELIRKDSELNYLIGALGYEYKEL